MNVKQCLAIVTSSLVSAVTGAAESQVGEHATTVRMMIQGQDRFVAMQVEYCLRNAPDLTADLVLAHATYVQASERAAQILGSRYPLAIVLRFDVFADGSDPKTRSFQLRQIQSRGPQQCDGLVSDMHKATGESLAATIGRGYESLRDRATNRQ
jgi:hypothetical protein